MYMWQKSTNPTLLRVMDIILPIAQTEKKNFDDFHQ